MTVLVLLIMVLLHIIDDFVLQLQSLSELKQKKTWEGTPDMYKNDYLVALAIHGLSWSIMVHLPLIALQFLHGYKYGSLFILISVLVNAAWHSGVDDMKANKRTISLLTDQVMHLIQIVFAWSLWIFLFPG